jgi:hypothetical protein
MEFSEADYLNYLLQSEVQELSVFHHKDISVKTISDLNWIVRLSGIEYPVSFFEDTGMVEMRGAFWSPLNSFISKFVEFAKSH